MLIFKFYYPHNFQESKCYCIVYLCMFIVYNSNFSCVACGWCAVIMVILSELDTIFKDSATCTQ